jgi:hypothetical protein
VLHASAPQTISTGRLGCLTIAQTRSIGKALVVSNTEQSWGGISKKAKAAIAITTAAVGFATGVLTLRDQIFGRDEPTPAATSATRDGGDVADITNDAEAKSRANRLSDVLKQCVTTTGRDYEGCNTAGILGAAHIPIGFGVGAVEVDVTSPATFELTSRSESGHVFQLQNFVTGEQVKSCTPAGAGGCPQDARW